MQEDGQLAVKFLGIISIILVLGFILCFLANLGFNTYFEYSDENKKIEVRAENSNLNNSDNWTFGKDLFLTFYLYFLSSFYIIKFTFFQ